MICRFSYGQDIGLVNISTPVTGCMLSANENITVQIFNFGPNINNNFNVSYILNGGTPVTETIVLGSPFLSSSSYTYTFTSQANLSTPGIYTFKAYTTLMGGINPANDTLFNYQVNSDTLSIGGSVIGNAAVCSGSNNGILTLSAHSGTVLNWEYTINGGANWITIPNITITQNYNNLTTDMMYRCIVKSGTCPAVNSDSATITIDNLSVGGIVSGDATVCSGSNNGTLTLGGYTGTILNWEYSTNNGANWTNIANASSIQNYTNLAMTTWYRALVKNGACAADTSSVAVIGITPPTAGGIVSGSTTACSGLNNGTLTLTGYIGTILSWNFSIDEGANWISVGNTSAIQDYTNLTTTTWFRAEVISCSPSAFSSVGIITVDPPSLGSAISGSTIVCSGLNNGTLTLTGYTGTILNWEYSTNEGGIWTNIAHTSATHDYANLTTTAWYRAIVKNNTCPAEASSIASITVSSLTVNAGNDTTINFGSTVILDGQGGVSYSWLPVTDLNNPNIANPIAAPSVTTSFVLTANDINGCTGTDEITIHVNKMEDFTFIISNLITLNGDGINDTWNIEGIENYPSSQVSVFNSYGNKVYSASPYMNNWDALYGGSKLPDGTYYYILKFTDSEKIIKGAITILSEN